MQFSELSEEAKSAIVDAAMGEFDHRPPPNLPEAVKEEIRRWRDTQPEYEEDAALYRAMGIPYADHDTPGDHQGVVGAEQAAEGDTGHPGHVAGALHQRGEHPDPRPAGRAQEGVRGARHEAPHQSWVAALVGVISAVTLVIGGLPIPAALLLGAAAFGWYKLADRLSAPKQ
jgi:hypothetical protein